jgi:hypothetical protein
MLRKSEFIHLFFWLKRVGLQADTTSDAIAAFLHISRNLKEVSHTFFILLYKSACFFYYDEDNDLNTASFATK